MCNAGNVARLRGGYMKKSKKQIEEQTPQQESQEQSAADVQVAAEPQSEANAQPTAETQTTEQQSVQPAADSQTATEDTEQQSTLPTADEQPIADAPASDGQQTVEAAFTDGQPLDADSNAFADAQPAQDEIAQSGKKKKKEKKQRVAADGAKKEKKVGFYIVSLFKYFNIITLLPLALLMYAVFFSSYIVDKGELFEKNVVWICIIMGVGALIMLAWFIDTRKKRRVCSLDAFLLMSLMICVSMVAQCLIFGNFKSFDGIAIASIAATAAILILMTVRLIMFKPSEQNKNDDSKYTAKRKLGMYFKVIFAKYMFFIAMLCVIGALLILIISQSDIFEEFEFAASNVEKAVTIVFAALAAVLMIVGLFIRIVRGRANVIDCMPYMFFIVGIGGIINFITRHIYMVLYVGIGAIVVGAVWLILCQYTLLMSRYQKKVAADGEDNVAAIDADGAQGAAEGVADAAQTAAEDTQSDNSAVENTQTDGAAAENTQTDSEAQQNVQAGADSPIADNEQDGVVADATAVSEQAVEPTAADNSTEDKPADNQN